MAGGLRIVALWLIGMVVGGGRAANSVGSSCTNFDSNMGSSFDLRELQRTTGQPSYRVEDGDIPCTKYVEANYTYIFNICGAVQDGIPEKCDDISGLNTAAALQVNTRGTVAEGDDWCFKVGAYSDQTSKLALLDERDPSKGVALTYYGDFCHAKAGQKPIQRTFRVELGCADRLSPVPTHAYETTACGYTVYMPSVYGCPVECPVAQRQLCAGNGHCAYDYDRHAARCFCNRGYGGADCAKTGSKAPASTYSPALLGLIITLFVIIAVLVASVVLMIKQVAAYKEDVSNYQVLKGGDEDETKSSLQL